MKENSIGDKVRAALPRSEHAEVLAEAVDKLASRVAEVEALAVKLVEKVQHHAHAESKKGGR